MSGRRTERITLAHAIVRFMNAQRVRVDGVEDRVFHGVWGIFGHGNVAGLGQALEEIGGAHLPVYQPKNEQGGVHAAIAFAKAKKRRAIMAVTTSVGPGATNMVTGAATATINRIPVLLLPGDIFANRRPSPVLQQLEHPLSPDISVNDCFKPVSRFWDRINRPEQILASLPEAVRVLLDPAQTGAVTLCLPEDVQAEAFDCPVSFFEERVHHMPRPIADVARFAEVGALLEQAKQPLIVAGGGVHYSDACTELAELAAQLGIPVATTQAGTGAIPATHPQWLGSLGVTGTACANAIAERADVVITVGTRLSDFTTASKTQFQHDDVRFVSINVNAMDAHKHGAIPLVGDARITLASLGGALGLMLKKPFDDAAVKRARDAWTKTRDALCALASDGAPLTQACVIKVLNENAKGATVVHAAGGIPGDIHRLWNSVEWNDYHSEYGYSCMGYEVAGALGVKLAEPKRHVMAFLGDGSWLMLHTEIVTAVQEGVKVDVVLLDNHGYGCIHNLQRGTGGRSFHNEFRTRANGRLSGDAVRIDFVKNAESYGARTFTAQSESELRAALREMRAEKRACFLYVPLAETSKLPGTSWWDVPPAEVSGVASVNEARAAYDEAVKKQRFHH